jgi:GNAT superfamily N-acetyltransferase
MEQTRELKIDGFLFSTNKDLLDVNYIHQFLSEKSYWAPGIPMHLVKKSIENSLCIGIYEERKQIGFARVITDYTTFGYLADVFVDEAYRGKGLSKNLMEFILSFEETSLFRRFLLATRDAHALYAQFGFTPLSKPELFMQIHHPSKYKTDNTHNAAQL